VPGEGRFRRDNGMSGVLKTAFYVGLYSITFEGTLAWLKVNGYIPLLNIYPSDVEPNPGMMAIIFLGCATVILSAFYVMKTIFNVILEKENN
jgi:hypothetical protein